QAGPEQFGAAQAGAGGFGAQAGPEQFRAEQGRAGEFGAHVGRDQFGAGQGRADQLASGSGGHGQFGSGQFGDGQNRAAGRDRRAQPGSPHRGGQKHPGSREPSRGTSQLAAAAQAGQQPGGTGQNAQPPQHAATSAASMHQGTHGPGGPRHEYGVTQ